MKTHRMFLSAIARHGNVAASLVLLALVLAMAASNAPVVHAGTTITVDAADDSNLNGDGKCTLREAIINANTEAWTRHDCAAGSSDDIINITATGTILLGSNLPPITNAVTIIGPGESNLSIDGQNSQRVLGVQCLTAGCSVNISGLTIQNGRADYASGLSVSNSNVTLSHVTMRGNTTNAAGSGAPIWFVGGSVAALNDVTISNNSSLASGAVAGGLYGDSGSTLSLNNVTLDGNTTYGANGGGAMAVYKAATLNNVTFSNNTTTAGNGGAISSMGTITVTNSVFTNNATTGTAANGLGGAVYNYGLGHATFTNVTFYQNSSSNSGSAIYNTSGSAVTVVNSTIADNTGFQAIGGYSGITLKNTIMANNAAGNCSLVSGNVTDGGGNLNWPSGGSFCPGITADPKLDTLANNGGSVKTRALLTGSGAINAGNSTTCDAAVGSPTYGAGGIDARGFPRRAGFCEIGAFEAQPAIVSTTAGSSPQSAVISTAFAHSLGANVTDANSNGLQGITVTYAAPASGASAVLSGTTAISDASGNVSVTATANALVGSYGVTASATGATPATFNLTNAGWPTTTTITSHSPHPSRAGEGVTVGFTVTSTYGTPTGNVTVSDGSVNCVGTVAAGSCTLTFQTGGTKTLTASYAGEGSFGGSPSGSVTHTVIGQVYLPLTVRP